MTTPNDLSNQALAVFAFAAYHQLSSGDVVTSVVSNDPSGHRADPAAIDELVQKQLATKTDNRLHLTDGGQLMLSQIIDRIKGTW
ncbi:MAG: hypothetical protein P0Y65_00320 [Candidatus Devosia phytovorans]|uniref:Uncharacterized protein n=1 Tax=Candidatus Devosia phytovorans TaxID=3121372 RepID=A0AAJ5VTY6_9HYPH|nr:hypothetical protein [Devosia sp.]WEK04739.1 MAG: hypothetical protein P0Y65_00320 [Devosia sp.]